MYVTFIKIPFISAFSIDDYVESLSMGIALSGDYVEAGYANDTFSGYLTGFNRFFSGSGYWLASGSSYPISTYLSDSFSGYTQQQYTYSSLNAGIIYQGFNTNTGLVSGNVYIISSLLNETSQNYQTGYFTGNFLTGGIYSTAYNNYTGYLTGSVYSF